MNLSTQRRPPQPRKRSARGQGAVVRGELIAAAETLLNERGEAASITVSDIVKRIGVTAPILYAHFTDKDALFVAVHLNRLDDFRIKLQRAAQKETSPLAALEQRGRAYIRYATRKQDAYTALFMQPQSLASDLFRDPVARRLTAYEDLVANVQACMDQGEINTDDAELVARSVWCQVHGVASLLITMPGIAEPMGHKRLIDRCIASITASLIAQ